jgi:hypothetical protein
MHRSIGDLGRSKRESKFKAPLLALAFSVVMPLTLLAATGSPVGAKSAAVDATNDLVACTGVSGTLKFSPPLTNGTLVTHETITFKATVSSCGAEGPSSVSIASGKLTGSLVLPGSSTCNSIIAADVQPLTGGLNVKWKTTPKLSSGNSVITPASGSWLFDTRFDTPDFTSPYRLFAEFFPSTPQASGSFTFGDRGRADSINLMSVETQSDIAASCAGKGLKKIDLAPQPVFGDNVTINLN